MVKQGIEWIVNVFAAGRVCPAMVMAIVGGSVMLATGTAIPAAAQNSSKAIILSINDVYRIEGIDHGRSGGMARVRALRAKLEKIAPDLIFLHAGDFLSPSFIGRTYHGEQMVDVMNIMDGNPVPGAFDDRMFVAFGNHEFDDTNCSQSGPLPKLVAQSEFTWLASNLNFTRCDPLKALADSPRVKTSRIIESGGLKIGLFAVTLSRKEYAPIVLDPLSTACRLTAELRQQGADAVVALTHLPFADDTKLLGFGKGFQAMAPSERLCQTPPDLVIGGHDHVQVSFPSKNPRLFKADADAKSAWVIEIEKPDNGELNIAGRLEDLGEGSAADPFVQRIVNHWMRQHGERFCLADCINLKGDKLDACREAVDHGACLDEAFTKTASTIETEEIYNRTHETGFGDWVTDKIREAAKADVALINAGGIRINQDIAAGTLLTRRHLEEMFAYKNGLIVRNVTGKALWHAMQHAVERPGEGSWAHFSGMAVKVGAGKRIEKILVKRWNGQVVEIGPDDKSEFKLASNSYVMANGDGHGFKLCPDGIKLKPCIALLENNSGWPLSGVGRTDAGFLRLELGKVDPARGLLLKKDHRLCEVTDQVADCLISKW